METGKAIFRKFCNRETISYLICGVLTTLVDWLVYAWLWHLGTDYRVSTFLSWAAAVLFAFVTNKFLVFRSLSLNPLQIGKELVSFTACRVTTGVLTMAGMILMVSGLHLPELAGKLIVSVLSLVLNYVFSKLFIFKKKSVEREM